MARKRKPAAGKKATPASAKDSFNGNYIREPDRIIDTASGKTLLIDAVQKGDEAMVRKLIKSGANINKRSKDGRTPLHYAASAGHVELIDLLFENGAAVNATDKILRTPLFDALNAKEPLKVVMKLASLGADGDMTDTEGRTPLHYAAEKSSALVVQFLVERTREPDRADRKGCTALHLAARENGLQPVQALLFARISYLLSNNDGQTALHLASARMDTAVAEYLLTTDARSLINAVDLNGKTALHLAIHAGNLGLCKSLIALGANVNLPDRDGVTPICEAAMANNTGIVKLLVDAGADISHRGHGKTPPPLTLVIRGHGNIDMVRFLLQQGADPNCPDKDGATPLMAALSANASVMALHLLDFGADPSKIDDNGKNALHYVGGLVPKETIEILIRGGAALDQREKNNGRTPLMQAVWERRPHIARIMTEMGANPNIADNHGSTPLHLALRYEEPALIEKLLAAKADPNAGDGYNKITPLMISCLLGNDRDVKKMLDAGANPNQKNSEGRTALHLSLLNGMPSFETIKHLLNKGADPLIEDDKGFTPYDFAFAHNRKPAMDLFKTVIQKKGVKYTPKKPPPNPWGGW